MHVWQRNGQYIATDADGKNNAKDPLEKLLEVLHREVEYQERIDMDLQRFGLSVETGKIKKLQHKTEKKETFRVQ